MAENAEADRCRQTAALLRAAIDRGGDVAVLTGAGVSAESGVPTFRGVAIGASGHSTGRPRHEALWSEYDPMHLASIEGFRADPVAVTRWYAWRRSLVRNTDPNAGHHALVEIEAIVTSAGGRFTLLTQNVDRLHHRAGSGSHGGRVVELHGNIHIWRSLSAGNEFAGAELDELLADDKGFPPRDPTDGSVLRPCVVWFGETLPSDAFEAAAEASSSCAVFIAAGTSAVVYPAAGLVTAASQNGSATVEINADVTPASGLVDITLRGASGIVLPELARQIKQQRPR